MRFVHPTACTAIACVLFAFWAPLALCGEILVEFVRAADALGEEKAAALAADPRSRESAFPICLPDDWEKTLVTPRGELSYLSSGTTVSVSASGADGAERRVRLVSPRIPIVEAALERGGERLVSWKCFAAAPGAELPEVDPERRSVILETTTNPTPLPGWARPAVPTAEAFRNIVAGFDGPIGYRFRAPPRARFTLALGFLESHHAEPGKRIVEAFVEGRKVARLDLIADVGRHLPAIVFADASDADGDGYVRIDVKPAPESEDQYPILNALWVFSAGRAPPREDLISGGGSARALAVLDCGGPGVQASAPPGPPRADVALIERARAAGRLEVRVSSREPLTEDEETCCLSGTFW